MKLVLEKRSAEKKKDAKRLRRANRIPVAVYNKGSHADLYSCDGVVISQMLEKIQKGHLPTSVFELEVDGKVISAVIKDIQYHVSTYAVLHIDFEVLSPGSRINIRVPLDCVGLTECVGIKAGGMLRQVIRHFPVNCPVEQIPKAFLLDVKNLDMNESLRLEAISLSSDIRPLRPLKEVAVSIVKR